MAYAKKGQPDLAIADFNKALEINPKDADAYSNRGSVRREKRQYDQAISDLNKALEINPNFDMAYYQRGRVYYLKGEYNKSWSDIKRAQDLGFQIPPEFLEDLRKASGRQN
jgi:tetratricopeptide (TPR) repeat protein